MENENKNKGNGKPHKHKSYFISPAPEQKDNNNVQRAAGTEGSAPSQDKPKHHKHKNKNKNRNPNQNPNQSQQKQEPSVQAPSNTPAPAAEVSERPQHSDKSRHNKNKHKKFDNSQSAPKEVQSKPADSASVANNEASEGEIAFSKFDKLEKPAQKKLDSFSSSPEFKNYQDYEEFTYDQLYGSKNDTAIASTSAKDDGEVAESVEEARVEVVGIRFKSSGKTYYFDPNGISLRIGLHAIVETARGLEYGEIVMGNTMIPESETVPPLRPVIRAATQADMLHNEEIKRLEESAFRVCNEKIIAHELDMKLIDAQYTFDNSKLLFYFTSSGRVDFRELVKDLASVFRTRIELRQIGIRDEAKMVGGLGMCGRPLCCSKFLTDFGQVSIKMAKEQNLSLNSAKISGICGRLMCCLRYEHETYEYEIKRTPPVDTLVRTVDGVGTVTEISPLQGTIKVRLAATPEVMPKSYKREEVTILKKKN